MILLILSLLVCSHATASLCPVLQSYYDQPLFYGYPDHMLLPSTLAANPHAKFRNCSSRNLFWGKETTPQCDTSKSLCAVTAQNVRTAMSVADWPQYAEGFRRIKAAIEAKKHHTANIYIIGGSMTRGGVTYSACFCDQIVDSTCPHNPDLNQDGTCSWPTMFAHWMSHAFPQLKIHNLAQSGLTSRMMADNFADFLRLRAFVTTLSSDDIVIIDHSVNDAGGLPKQLKLGFESLIRRIFHLAADGARPTLVVMEQHPIGSFMDKADVPPGDYAAIYRDLSKYYGLIHISLREVSWTYLNFTTVGALNTTANGQIVVDGVQKVRMYPIAVDREMHPPWWRHLFVADVLADSLMHIMSSVHAKNNPLFVGNTSSVGYTMPAPLHDLSQASSAVCDLTKPIVLDIHANATFTPKDVHAFETDLTTVSKAGWREYIDYHNTPGFIINALSDPAQASLHFPLAEQASYEYFMIKIIYLKSYTGMGVVYIRLCGDNVHEHHIIDALYHDHATYKVSLPTEFIYTVSGGDNSRCLKLPAKERTLEILYVRTNDDFKTVRAHAHQKFKVMAAEVCMAAPLVR